MRIVLAALCSSLLALTAFAADNPDRAKLAGSWQLEDGKDSGTVWVIEDKGSTIHLTRSVASRKVAEIECNIPGRECDGKDSGHKITVSMWFNGGVLVQMETKGPEVVKRRFAISGQGDILELQTVLITPAGPTETAKLKRVASGVSTR